jgi:hypothetical protein
MIGRLAHCSQVQLVFLENISATKYKFQLMPERMAGFECSTSRNRCNHSILRLTFLALTRRHTSLFLEFFWELRMYFFVRRLHNNFRHVFECKFNSYSGPPLNHKRAISVTLHNELCLERVLCQQPTLALQIGS